MWTFSISFETIIIKFIKEIDNNIKVTNVVSQDQNPLHIRKKKTFQNSAWALIIVSEITSQTTILIYLGSLLNWINQRV